MSQLLQRVLLGTGVLLATSSAPVPTVPNDPITIELIGADIGGEFRIQLAAPNGAAGRHVVIPFLGLAPRPVDPGADAGPALYDEFIATTILPQLDETNQDAAPNLNGLLNGLGITGNLPPIPPKIIADALDRLTDGSDPLAHLNQHSQSTPATGQVHWDASAPGWGPGQQNRILDWTGIVSMNQNSNGAPDTTLFDRRELVEQLVEHQRSVLYPTSPTASAWELDALVGIIEEKLVTAQLWWVTLYVPTNPSLANSLGLGAPTAIDFNLSKEENFLADEVNGTVIRANPPVDMSDPFFHVTTAEAEVVLEVGQPGLQTDVTMLDNPYELFVQFPRQDGTLELAQVTDVNLTPDYYLDGDRKGALITTKVPAGLEHYGALTLLRIRNTPTGTVSENVLFLTQDESLTPFAYFIAVRGPEPEGLPPLDPITQRNLVLGVYQFLYSL